MAASPPPDEDSEEFDEDDAFGSLRFIFGILPDITSSMVQTTLCYPYQNYFYSSTKNDKKKREK